MQSSSRGGLPERIRGFEELKLARIAEYRHALAEALDRFTVP